jgi:nitrous oxidase accessory protein
MTNFFILLFFFISFSLQSQNIKVCTSCNVKTIKEAIAKSQDGDTIFIKKGVYKEHKIIIHKAIHLIGLDNPIIDGENKESIFKVNADNFSIEGLTIINVGQSYTKDFAGISVLKSKHFTIKNNVLKNVYFGILLEKSSYGIIKNNKVSSNAKDEFSSGNGIHMWYSSHMQIIDNEASGLRDGIYFEFVKHSVIHGNKSHNNVRYGMHFMFSNYDEYYQNEFRNNGAGVAVMFSKFINMHDNIFHYNWGSSSYGLLLKEIYDTQIKNNIFEKNTVGINIENCTRIEYQQNNFIRNGWAVKFSGGCYNNIFKKNNFLSNSFDLSYSSSLNNNKFDSNFWGDYTGYDLDKNGVGDVPFRPVKLFSYIVNNTPETIVLLRSLFVDMINFSEKVSPIFTPKNLVDKSPLMHRVK